jgi:hypothetical protein
VVSKGGDTGIGGSFHPETAESQEVEVSNCVDCIQLVLKTDRALESNSQAAALEHWAETECLISRAER